MYTGCYAEKSGSCSARIGGHEKDKKYHSMIAWQAKKNTQKTFMNQQMYRAFKETVYTFLRTLTGELDDNF
jgi:hypothetical protein